MRKPLSAADALQQMRDERAAKLLPMAQENQDVLTLAENIEKCAPTETPYPWMSAELRAEILAHAKRLRKIYAR